MFNNIRPSLQTAAITADILECAWVTSGYDSLGVTFRWRSVSSPLGPWGSSTRLSHVTDRREKQKAVQVSCHLLALWPYPEHSTSHHLCRTPVRVREKILCRLRRAASYCILSVDPELHIFSQSSLCNVTWSFQLLRVLVCFTKSSNYWVTQ